LSIKNTFSVLNFLFSSLNAYLIIFITSISGLVFLLSKYNIKEKKLLFTIFLAIIFIFQINFMKGDFHRYFVYTDYLVVLILGVVLNRFEKKISLLFATVALILIFLVNQNYIEVKKKIWYI